MRIALAFAAAAVLLAGCAPKQEVVKAAPPPELTRDDCRTVVLFEEARVAEPHESVPPEHSAFLGHWQKGAWSGKWCHDILVTAVYPDGSADLFDMHAPYAPWGKPATAFKRKARINDSGVMTFRHGTEVRRYRVVDGRLHAVRSGATSELHAVLINPETEQQVAKARDTQVDMPTVVAEEASPAPVKLAAKTGPALTLEKVPALTPGEGFGATAAPVSAEQPPVKGTTG